MLFVKIKRGGGQSKLTTQLQDGWMEQWSDVRVVGAINLGKILKM